MRHFIFDFAHQGKILFLSLLFITSSTLAQTSLPFSENWESGTFSTHGWTTNSGNGYITLGPGGTSNSTAVNLGHESTQSGINPVVLDSPILDGTYTTSGLLTFSFDYRFDNPDSTRWHYLKVYCNTGQDWELLHEFSFHASFGWKEFKTHLGMAYGKNFRIRFASAREADTAYGSWYLDNIVITGAETPSFPLQTIAKTENPENLGVHVLWKNPVSNSNTNYTRDSISYYDSCGVNTYLGDPRKAYGTVFDISSFGYPLLYQLDFQQTFHSEYMKGKSVFQVRIYDWDTMELLDTLGPFITKHINTGIGFISSFPENGFSLNLKQYSNVKNIGIFLEPLVNVFGYMYPAITGDDCLDNSNSYVITKHPFNIFSDSWVGKFTIKLHILDQSPISSSNLNIVEKGSPTYSIYRWKQSLPLNYTLLNSIAQTDTAFFDTEVEKDYFSYYVQANYADGSHILSDTSTIYFPLTQGVVNPASVKIELSPNPAQQYIKLKSNNTMESAEIINTNGKRLIIHMINTQKDAIIPVSQLSSGLYILRILNTDGSRSQLRFIKE